MDEKTLNRQLAELLGYTVRFNTSYLWKVYAPNGTMVFSRELHATESAAWADTPDWERSLDAVLAELPRQERCDFLIFRGERTDQFTVAITRGAVHLPNTSWVGKGETEQRAAARALLKYAEWKREQQA
ncbi:MAG: hypothetical protein AB7V46_21910 [Thermomicrobiales bacterium]